MADITFNGKKRTINEDINIATFISDNNYKPERVVVELNEEIIPIDKYEQIVLKQNDTLEVLSFMGGGWLYLITIN